MRLNRPRILKTIKTILRNCKVKDAALAFVFVSRQKISSINKKFLKKTYATDVIAFDYMLKKKRDVLNGDIIISTDAVVKNAKKYKTSSRSELDLYMIHGILHLLGYRDGTEKEIARMRKKEEELLQVIRSTL